METTLFDAGGAARHAASRPRPRRASEELQAYRALARSRRAPAPLSFSAKSEADCQDGAFLRHRRLASRRPGPSRPQACRDDAGAAPR
jgi:hypothetical protein